MRIGEVEAILGDPNSDRDYITKGGSRVRIEGIDAITESGPYSWSKSRKRRLVRVVWLNRDTGEETARFVTKPIYHDFTPEEQAEQDAKTRAQYGYTNDEPIPSWRRVTREEMGNEVTDTPLRVEARDIVMTWKRHLELGEARQKRDDETRAARARLHAAFDRLELPHGGSGLSLSVGDGWSSLPVSEANKLAEALEKLEPPKETP